MIYRWWMMVDQTLKSWVGGCFQMTIFVCSCRFKSYAWYLRWKHVKNQWTPRHDLGLFEDRVPLNRLFTVNIILSPRNIVISRFFRYCHVYRIPRPYTRHSHLDRSNRKGDIMKIFAKVGECLAHFHRWGACDIFASPLQWFDDEWRFFPCFDVISPPWTNQKKPSTTAEVFFFQGFFFLVTWNSFSPPGRRYGGRQHNDAGTQNILYDEDDAWRRRKFSEVTRASGGNKNWWVETCFLLIVVECVDCFWLFLIMVDDE